MPKQLNSFAIRVINEWNSLPSSIVQATNIAPLNIIESMLEQS